MEVVTPLAFPVIAPLLGELTFFFDPNSESVFAHSIWEPPKA